MEGSGCDEQRIAGALLILHQLEQLVAAASGHCTLPCHFPRRPLCGASEKISTHPSLVNVFLLNESWSPCGRTDAVPCRSDSASCNGSCWVDVHCDARRGIFGVESTKECVTGRTSGCFILVSFLGRRAERSRLRSG